MPDAVVAALEAIARTLEIVGAGMLVLGFIIGTVRFFYDSLQNGVVPSMLAYRNTLGRSVLIGLEILVAATIIKTITLEPSVEGVGLLVSMVAIRTLLGWTTVLEMTGRWPWRPEKKLP